MVGRPGGAERDGAREGARGSSVPKVLFGNPSLQLQGDWTLRLRASPGSRLMTEAEGGTGLEEALGVGNAGPGWHRGSSDPEVHALSQGRLCPNQLEEGGKYEQWRDTKVGWGWGPRR